MDNGHGSSRPVLATTNIFDQDAASLAHFARANGFDGIDWSFSLEETEVGFLPKMRYLADFEVRFHCRFPRVDLAYGDDRAEDALRILRRCIRFSSLVGGRFITVHIGLGLKSGEELDWKTAVRNLTDLVRYGSDYGVTVCLENLPSLWTSVPETFALLIEETGAGVTIDVGHAEFCMEKGGISSCIEYIEPHPARVFNAHIYHREIPGMGHLAPDRIEEMETRLEPLANISSCGWWVIELAGADETIRTRDMLSKHLDSMEAIPSHARLDGVGV